MNEQEKFFEDFNKGLHRIGKITMLLGLIALVAVPFLVASIFRTSIDMKGFVNGFVAVAIIYMPMSVAEFLVYVPMLGAGGSYISFITGNVTNMKIPCAMHAREIAGTEVGTPENEIISTISTATSAIVTTLVVALGVVLIIPLQPILNSATFSPAFEQVIPALFGALGLKYFTQSFKIAVVPVVLLSVLCILVPSLVSQTSTMIIPGGALALLIAFVLFKKGKL